MSYAETANDVEKCAKEYLIKKYSLNSSKFELKTLNGIPDNIDSGWKITEGGKYWVKIDAQKGKNPYSFIIKFKLMKWIYAFCASGNIKSKDTVTESSYKKEKMAVEPDFSDYITDETYLNGKRAKYYIPQNAIIKIGSLEEKPPIKRNDTVKVLVQNGGISVITQGTALEDGFYGNPMKIRLSSGKILTGNLSEKGYIIINL